MDSPPRFEVRLLGAIEMSFDGKPWTVWMPPRCALLLALIALHEGGQLSRATLASTLWPDELDSDARTNLRRHLHELQRAMPHIDGVEWIVHDGKNLRWNDDAPAWVDVRAFRALQFDPSRAREAAAAYRGDLLDGMFDESIVAERERLGAQHRELLLRLIRAARGEREHASAVDYANALLAVDPWREDALREWMTATYQSGDRDAALEAFDEFARRLRDEFATAPTAETIALRDAIESGLALPDDAEERFERSLSEPALRAWNMPFVGRDEDLGRLRAMWTRAARGNGGTAFVSGEAGIGKSRLAAELGAIAREQGAFVLRGASADPETSPYQAVLDALRGAHAHLLQIPQETPWLPELSRVLPELSGVRVSGSQAAHAGSSRNADRLFDAICAAIAYLARQRPICILLEDLHWAGPATVDLVEAMARRIGVVPVMILVTYRSGVATTGQLRSVRAALVRERRASAIPLERLGRDDVATMVATLASRDAGRELDERIAQLSDGNPLFVAQLLEGYRETGRLPDEASALSSVGDAIASRVGRLEPEIRDVAQAAATAGQPFRCGVVAEIGGWSETRVLDALGALMDRSLVSEAGDGSAYAFSHALIAAAFYSELNPQIRAERHRRIAAILERETSGPDASGAAARHWERGERALEAAAAYVRSARAAERLYAREDAVAAAHRAYDLAQDDRTRFDAISIATSVASGRANLDRWLGDIERAERAAVALGDAERFIAARARERYAAQVLDFTMHERAVDDLDALAARSGDLAHRAYAEYARGYLEMQRGNLEASTNAFARGLKTALVAGNPEELSRIREEYISVLIYMGRWDVARAEFEEHKKLHAEHLLSELRQMSLLVLESVFASMADDAPRLERAAVNVLEEATRLGDTYNVARAHMLFVQSAGLQFDLQAMREHYRIASDLFMGLGELRAAAVNTIVLANMETSAGRCDLAFRALENDAPLIERLNAPDVRALVLLARADALVLSGTSREALAAAEVAFVASPEIDEPRKAAEAGIHRGAAHARAGNYDDAIAHLRAAIEQCREFEATAMMGYAMCWFIEACCDAQRPLEAQPHARELQKLVEERPEAVLQPTFACRVLARTAQTGEERARWLEAGAAILRKRLGLMKDPADAAAFAKLFFNAPT
jgi:DNA-binding SARP family transcriptional activator